MYKINTEVSIQLIPNRFSIGDRVIITNPAFVERVGYPLSYEEAYKICTEHYMKNIDKLLRETVYRRDGEPVHKPSGFSTLLAEDAKPEKHSKDLQMLLGGLTRMYMKEHRFGGTERTIHTKFVETWLGRVCEVVGKRVCKTGTYDAPYSYQDHNGEWECYSGGLSNCKTHVLLELAVFSMIEDINKDYKKYPGTWIESCNVRLYAGPEYS